MKISGSDLKALTYEKIGRFKISLKIFLKLFVFMSKV